MMRYLFLGVFTCLLVACGGDATDEAGAEVHEKEVDLMSYNLPLKIYAPEGYTVEAQDDILDDVLVKGPNYYVQIYGTATTQARAERKKEELEKVKSAAEFEQLLLDEPYGFVYKSKLEGEEQGRINFFYVLNKGDKTYTFQSTTRFDPYTEEDIRKMYASVKQE